MGKYLGVIAYAFIVLFQPAQLSFMFVGRNVDLSAWPLVSLVAGLALLQYAVVRDKAPAYIRWGNAACLVFAAANLGYVLIAQ